MASSIITGSCHDDVIMSGWAPTFVTCLSLLVGLCSSGHVTDCPPTCYCNTASRVIQCARRGLDFIPEIIPDRTRQMNLNGNKFQVSTVGRHNFTRYPGITTQVSAVTSRLNDQLEHLCLSDCGLRIIEPGAFVDLRDLRWLDLSDNLIETVVQSTFSGLHLEHLFLNGNRRLVLVLGSFTGLSTSGLYLHDCGLDAVDVMTLSPLRGSLRTLWLQANSIRRLKPEMQPLVTSLVDFRCDSNPLQCDCELTWLKHFYDSRMHQTLDNESSPTCAGPLPVNKRTFASLLPTDFRCRLPVIGDVDTDFDGRNGRLRCTANGDPTPDVRWIQLAPSQLTEATYMFWTEMTSFEGTSVAELVLKRDSIDYTNLIFSCVASNAAGNVTLTVNLQSYDVTHYTSGSSESVTSPGSVETAHIDGLPVAADVLFSLMLSSRRSKSTSGAKEGVVDHVVSVTVKPEVVRDHGSTQFVVRQIVCAVILTVATTVATVAGICQLISFVSSRYQQSTGAKQAG